LNFTKKEILAELDAMIAKAWGEQKALDIRHDPALARTLEDIKQDIEELYADAERYQGVIMKKIRLVIEEEYGYRHWIADLTPEELEEIRARWKTMRGLISLVPVRAIIPQAREVSWSRNLGEPNCHIHEEDDSFLEGVEYKIPEDKKGFSIAGKFFPREQLFDDKGKSKMLKALGIKDVAPAKRQRRKGV